MSAIKKMNAQLEVILGREPTIFEQIDILILNEIRNRVTELQLLYQVDPNDQYKKQYEHAVRCMQEVQDRNPEIFPSNDSDGGGYE